MEVNTIYWKQNEFKLWILLLCAYHFFPFITTKGTLVMYAWAYGIPIIYMLINLNYVKKIISDAVNSEVLICIICIVVLICLSAMIPGLYGTNDFTYFTDAIMTFIKILIRMFFIVLVIVKHIPNATKETFMKYFIFSCCLYICGTIVMLIVPEIKNIFYELVKESEYSKVVALETRYSTRYGWGGFSGFEYTFKCVLAMIFNDYLINRALKKGETWGMIGISFFLLLGTLFYGRIGLLFGMVVLVVMFMRLFIKRPCIFLVVVCAVGAAFLGLLFLQSKNATIQAWFEWAFDLFITFIQTGKLETASSNVLLDKMLFLPEIQTILFGDGRYTATSGNYYMSTDAGIMRPLLFGGITFVFIRYLSIIIVLIFNIFKKGQLKEEKQLFSWILLLNVVFEIKGEIVFSCLPIIIWLIIIERYEKRGRANGTRFEL